MTERGRRRDRCRGGPGGRCAPGRPGAAGPRPGQLLPLRPSGRPPPDGRPAFRASATDRAGQSS
ncbi:hypothetical protein SFRA_022345 [Streptomyces xinghaiensis]|uniref:Uncharacterized protein n=1 Tax=Streptomyces xinghaiensis TaxID=1038928 RepID=A0A420UZ87_9ACTN|nr:hypothetical protein SFRA_022345 [Streptomyces xinghaiensis]RNC71157.1 hypothetical protein DC095_023045 [Streptomyces xinghaiensis]